VIADKPVQVELVRVDMAQQLLPQALERVPVQDL
jgi:hypothetical protein